MAAVTFRGTLCSDVNIFKSFSLFVALKGVGIHFYCDKSKGAQLNFKNISATVDFETF